MKYFIPKGTRVWLFSGEIAHARLVEDIISERDMCFSDEDVYDEDDPDSIDYEPEFAWIDFKLPPNNRNITKIQLFTKSVKKYDN